VTTDSGSVHAAAQAGFSAKADAYVRGRPAYGADTLDVLDELIGSGAGWMADVGAGTGALSALLAARGHAVVAVEPVRAMLERCPAGPARIQATADAIPLAGGSLRAITVATAFHWFSTSEALDEMRRSLRSDGTLILLWNDRDNSYPWVAHHTELVDAHAGETPRFKTMRWQRVVEEHGGFEEIAYHELPNPSPSTRQGLVDRVMSTSFIAALPSEEGERVRAQAAELAATLPEAFDYPYLTRIWAYRPTSA
jgi:SAM-dependent methyltransferase